MKRLILLAALLGFALSSLQAQYWEVSYIDANINPGELNTDDEVPVTGGLPTSWTVLVPPTTTPVWSASTPLPFPFSFNGTAVTSFMVSNSAVVTFDVTTALPAPAFGSVALPAATVPNKSVCILGLKGTGANDNIVTKTFGTAPHRQFWIGFNSYSGTVATDYYYYSIVLEETTNRIYVVDQRSSSTSANSIGIQVDALTAYTVPGSPSVDSYSGTNYTPNDNTYYVFVPGTQPSFDMTATAVTTPKYLAAGNVTITGTIRNLGTTTINSATINYSINGGAVQTAALTGLNIASLASYNFSHATNWAATPGNYMVDVYATNLNGSNPDANPSDDHKSKGLYVMSANLQRTPLFEVFTSSTCPPCKQGNLTYHTVIDPKPATDFVSIKFQQDFPGTGDPYTTAEAVSRRGYYGINSIPRMEIDGGWDGNAASFTNTLYDAARANLPQYQMNGTYSLTNKTIDAKIKYSPLISIAGATLFVAILEKHTTANVKTNGETEFFHVMKKMMPSQTGTAITGTIGNWDSLALTYTFNGNYRLPTNGQAANVINHTIEHSVENFQNLYVVAWIEGADKVVYQAANLTSLSTGIQSFSQIIGAVSVYPNPTSESVQVQIEMKTADQVLATLVGSNGQVIESQSAKMNVGKNTLTFDTSKLAAGVYNMLLFDANKNASVHEIIVVH